MTSSETGKMVVDLERNDGPHGCERQPARPAVITRHKTPSLSWRNIAWTGRSSQQDLVHYPWERTQPGSAASKDPMAHG